MSAERQVSYVSKIFHGADSQRVSCTMIWRMVASCAVMLFPYWLLSYMPEKKDMVCDEDVGFLWSMRVETGE